MDRKTICRKCRNQEPPVLEPRGSGKTELLLWVLLFWTLVIPLGYSVWRRSSRITACSICRSTQLVAADSEEGRALADRAEGDYGGESMPGFGGPSRP